MYGCSVGLGVADAALVSSSQHHAIAYPGTPSYPVSKTQKRLFFFFFPLSVHSVVLKQHQPFFWHFLAAVHRTECLVSLGDVQVLAVKFYLCKLNNQET